MNPWYIVAGSLIFLGIVLFIYFASRKKYRDPSAAQNYEKVRNKLTVREEEPEEDDDDDYETTETSIGFSSGINSLIGAFIVIVIGFIIIGQVTTSFQIGISSSNFSLDPIIQIQMDYIPYFFGVIVVMSALIMLSKAIRNFCLIGEDLM